MARMTRVSPPELAREFPGPQASTSVTLAPPRRSISAVQPPKAPAPTTTTAGAAAGAAATRRAGRAAVSSPPAPPASSARRERRLMRSPSEVESRRDAEGPGLVDQEALARQESALAVQRQERPLVGDVVDVERDVPEPVADADPEVENVVGRQEGVERERGLCRRATD